MTTKEKIFYTAKYERVFYSVMIKKENHILMEKLLSTILNTEVKVLAYPRTTAKVNTTKEKVKVSDIIITLDKKLVHLEIETGLGKETKVKNYTNFSSIYSQNSMRGKKYDVETIFIHICLQFGEKNKNYLINKYYIQNEKQEKYIENAEFYLVNVDKIKEFWYANNKEEIEKYKYIIMLDLEKEELKKLGKEDKIVKIFAKNVIGINEGFKFINPISREKQKEYVENTRKYYEGFNEGTMEIAKKMLANSVPPKDIAKYTNLTIEEINKLK